MGRPARRKFIERLVDLDDARLLEVGAMDSPTFPELDVRYLDWFSRDELRASLSGNPNRLPDRVVEPDFVVKEKRFVDRIPQRFDLIIANHVLEHIADPIRWLAQLEELTRPQGSLVMALPDRRYTFDYLRPTSSVADFVRAHSEDLERPSRWQMLEAIFYHRPIRAADVWEGRHEEKLGQARFSLDQAVAASEKAEREYVDVHCHVFTAGTFPSLIEDLAAGGYLNWRVALTEDVEEGSNEFLVQLALP